MSRAVALARNIISRMAAAGSLLVAFSGGVDSAVVAKLAFDALGTKALAVTVDSRTLPRADLKDAKRLAQLIGIRHMVVEHDELAIPDFRANPPDRCYLCRKSLAEVLRKIADKECIARLADGATASDLGEHRPGIRAASEAGFWHPLMDARALKSDVRAMAKSLGLPVYNRPSSACLSSRIPYGEEITPEKLERIELAEAFLKSLGFTQVRVRAHECIARIEVNPDAIPLLMNGRLHTKVVEKLKSLGFAYVTVDLQGYRSGSLDEVLKQA